MNTLTARTISALTWSVLERIGAQGAQFAISIVLARLLTPAEFGLIGMVAVFLAVSKLFIESGFGVALIQKPNVTHLDKCSIFYFNLAISVVATGCLYFAAPYIAGFYHESTLKPLTRILSLSLIINAIGVVHGRLLTKQIDFKTQTKVSIYALLLSGGIGVFCALRGLGVWSLAIQILTNNLFTTLFLWVFNKWRPSLSFSLAPLRQMLGYGGRMFATGLLNTLADNLYFIVIGRLFSATELGLYTRARTVQQMPSQGVAGVVGRVTFPVFASIQTDPQRLKQGLRKALAALACINFPMMVGLAVVAKPLVIVLLTRKWLPCVPYLQVLCIAGMLYPVNAINLNILKAVGRSDLVLRLGIIKQCLVLVNIAVCWRWGIMALIWGQVVISVSSYYINSYYSAILIGYPITEQIRDILPYCISSGIMGGLVWAVKAFAFQYPAMLLLAQVIPGVLIYFLLARLFRLSAVMEGWGMFQSQLAGLGRPR